MTQKIKSFIKNIFLFTKTIKLLNKDDDIYTQ